MLEYGKKHRKERYWNDAEYREREKEYSRKPDTREKNKVLKRTIRQHAHEITPEVAKEKIVIIPCEYCGLLFGVLKSEYNYRTDVKGQRPRFHSKQCYGLSLRGRKKHG